MPSLAAARFPLLLVCFFASGFAALLYETAWTREFGFVFGTSELAVAAVLAAYMAGLALGAAVAGRIAQRLRRPILVYGALEGGIALWALAVPYAIRVVRAGYLGLLGGLDAPPETVGLATALLHLFGAFVVLVPCTAMMGATLPLLAHHAVHEDEQVGPRVGLLYGVNTAGAIFGALTAGFVLLPEVGLRHTVHVGVAVNVLVFAAAAALARGAAPEPARVERPRLAHRLLLPAMLVSGAASFTNEVVWVRLLAYVIGGSTAAFATMLSSFLLGVALGSALASRFARSPASSLVAFALAQVSTAVCAVGAFALADRLPALAAALGASAHQLGPGLLVGGAVLLPMTLCIGATFPFAVRAVVLRAEDASAASARVYAWNTVGSIVGSLGAGFALLPWLGLAGTVLAAAAANLALAAAALAGSGRRLAAGVAAAGMVGVAALPLGPPEDLLRTSVLTGRMLNGPLAALEVGRSATVSVVDLGSSWRILTNGLPEASIDRDESPPERTLASWLSIAPVLYRPETESMLIVGLGGGVTLGAVPPSVAAVDVIELEPGVVEINRRFVERRGGPPLDDPRVRLVLGDARGALILSDRRYDAIVSQPSHPWTSGSSHLYTREFFEMVSEHLAPGGIFVQWLGIRFASEDQFRSLLATLNDTFAHVEVLRPIRFGMVFVASDGPLDLAASAPAALAPPGFPEEGLYRGEDALAALSVDAAATRVLARGAPLITDDRNRLASRRGAADPDWETRVFADHDALLTPRGADPAALGRRLASISVPERVERIAAALGEPDGAVLRGWDALGRRRPRRAQRFFDRAAEVAPDHPGIRMARLLTRPAQVPVEGLSERELALRTAILARDDLAVLEAQDAGLAEWEPGSPVFPEATRLRVRWRVEAEDPERAAEALALLDRSIPADAVGADLLARARAGWTLGDADIAWASLERLLRAAGGPPLFDRALGLTRRLPASDPRAPGVVNALRRRLRRSR